MQDWKGNIEKRILICPLDWGLGHASRMIPIIHDYQKKGYQVVVAADGAALRFLRQELTGVKFETFKGVKVRYFKKPFFFIGLFLYFPAFAISILYEQWRTWQLLKKWKPELVISDNRYGVLNRRCKSVLVTHQVFIQLPNLLSSFQGLLHRFTRMLIQRFNECWIPDYEEFDNSLAGNLSHGKHLPLNAKYIGPLSRFNWEENNSETSQGIDALVIVSGPEPHRSIFEKEMERRFDGKNQSVLMILGKPRDESFNKNVRTDFYEKRIHKVGHLRTNELMHCIKKAKRIYVRTGYSSLMDLEPFMNKTVWSPTPGQTEQEYLFRWINFDKVIKHQ